MNYKFQRKLRLTTEAQFKQVYKARRKIPTEMFSIYYCYNSLAYPRLGVIVPKRNIKQAVKRNFFKRTLREYFRLNQYYFKNVDIVIIINNQATKLSKEDLNRLLELELKNIKKSSNNSAP